MQIREIQLSELLTAYEILKYEKKDISYKEFEDLVYEMIKENYKIITIIEKDKAVTYAGIKIETNLSYKKHLHVYELITNINENSFYYNDEMISFLIDYAKMNLCKNIVFSVCKNSEELYKLIVKNNFIKAESSYVKEIK